MIYLSLYRSLPHNLSRDKSKRREVPTYVGYPGKHIINAKFTGPKKTEVAYNGRSLTSIYRTTVVPDNKK